MKNEKISFVIGTAPKIEGEWTWSQIFEYITDTGNKPAIESLRELRVKSKEKYQKVKNSKLHGFLPNGIFKYRSDNSLTSYSPNFLFDIDGVSDPIFLELLKTKICNDDYVKFCFISPSDQGIKFMVRSNNVATDHEKIYCEIGAYYSDLLNIPFGNKGMCIDAKCKNISRYHYISYDGAAYWNDDSTVWSAYNISKNNDNSNNVDFGNINIFELCKELAENRHGGYVEGNRNHFLFSYSCMLAENGIQKNDIVSYCTSNFNEIDVSEIEKASANGYNFVNKKGKFGVYDKPQLVKAVNTIRRSNGQDNISVVARPSQPAKPKEKSKPVKKELSDWEVLEDKLRELYDFRYNMFSARPEFSPIGKNDFIPMSDYNLKSILRRLKHANLKTSKEEIKDIITSDFSPSIDPINDWFSKLPHWDGVDRVGAIIDTLPVEDRKHFEKYFRMWLVGAVANVKIKKRCANHLCLVLTGGQGTGKTTWLNSLCPSDLDEYIYTGKLKDPDNKDAMVQLAENLIINIDDQLDEINRHNADTVKNLITTDFIKLRRPYGSFTDKMPRIASFVASVNQEHFLYDSTGSRRFVVGTVNERVDFDKINKLDITQLYAQAVMYFDYKFKYYPDGDEVVELNEYNEKYEVQSKEYDMVQELFKASTNVNDERLTFTQIHRKLEVYTKGKISRKNLGGALKRLGFKKISANLGDGSRVRMYLVKERGNLEFSKAKLDNQEN